MDIFFQAIILKYNLPLVKMLIFINKIIQKYYRKPESGYVKLLSKSTKYFHYTRILLWRFDSDKDGVVSCREVGRILRSLGKFFFAKITEIQEER